MDGRYCAYLRKSRSDEIREKVESGYDALSHHRQSLIDLSARMGVEITRWYCDGIKSGDSIESRPEMAALLESVSNGEWDGVLCMEVERLTRGDMVDQGTVGRAFVQSGTLIVTPSKVYDPSSDADMEYFEFGLFMSRREFKAINRRLVAGRLAASREGQYIGSCAPYGYDKVTIDGKHTLSPNKDAQFVREVFKAYKAGKSYREIARMLDAMGARTMKGGKWNPNSVRKMVMNPVYIGKVVWNATKQQVYRENGRTRYRTVSNPDVIEVDGLHPAIVSEELWNAALRRREAAPVRGEYQTRNHYGRILTCADCGKALYYNNGGNVKEPILVHLRDGGDCPNKGCRVSVLDNAVVDALLSIAEDAERRKGKSDCGRGMYEKAIAQSRKAIDDNFDRMERGIISEDDFVSRRAVLEARISEAQDALDSLPEDDGERVVRLRDAIEAIRDPDKPEDEKREIIWKIVDRMRYRNRAPQGKDAIELEIFLR